MTRKSKIPSFEQLAARRIDGGRVVQSVCLQGIEITAIKFQRSAHRLRRIERRRLRKGRFHRRISESKAMDDEIRMFEEVKHSVALHSPVGREACNCESTDANHTSIKTKF